MVSRYAKGLNRGRGSTALFETALAELGCPFSQLRASVRDYEHTMPITERASLLGVDVGKARMLRVEARV